MAIKTITNDNFTPEVLQAAQPTLVEFWAPWCVYCKRLSPVLDRLSEKWGDALPIGKINVDEQPELESQFGVEVIPSLFLFQNGEHGEMLVAPASQAQLEQWVTEQKTTK